MFANDGTRSSTLLLIWENLLMALAWIESIVIKDTALTIADGPISLHKTAIGAVGGQNDGENHLLISQNEGQVVQKSVNFSFEHYRKLPNRISGQGPAGVVERG